MKNFYIIFKITNYQTSIYDLHDEKSEMFYRLATTARSMGEAERKFNKKTTNKFGSVKKRTIHKIELIP